MSVHAFQHAENLHPADDVLYALSGVCQHSVLLTMLGKEV
jgi:hypothetical protein